MGFVVTAGLSAFGSTKVPDEICFSVLTPSIFPNTGAVIDTASLVVSVDEPLGTLPVYAHTPPQPYFMSDAETTRLPFNMITFGGLALPPLVKFRGP